MDFVIVLLSLCAMTAANHQQLSPSNHSLLRPLAISPQSQHKGALWGSEKDVLNSQNVHPSIDVSHPIAPLNLHMHAIPMEEDQSDALDFGLSPTVTIPDSHHKNNLLHIIDSSRDLYTSTVQKDQPKILPYQGPNLLYPEPNDELSSFLSYLDAGTRQLPSLLPGPYDLNQQYIPKREASDRFVPEWTSMEGKVQHAVNVLLINMVNPKSETVVPWWDTRAEYTLILGVVLELMEQVAIHGQQSYDDIFTRTVLVSLAKIRLSLSTKKLAQQLVEAIMEVGRASTNVRGYINSMTHSAYCKSPSLCNKYIDVVLQTTKNQRLQGERQLLLAAANLADIFQDYYAEEFDMAAKHSMAYLYFGDLLRRGDFNELKPLVVAGAVVIRHVKELSQAQHKIKIFS